MCTCRFICVHMCMHAKEHMWTTEETSMSTFSPSSMWTQVIKLGDKYPYSTEPSHQPLFLFWRSSSVRYRTRFLFPFSVASREGTQDPVHANHAFPPLNYPSYTDNSWLKVFDFFLTTSNTSEITHCLWNSKIPDDKSDNLTGDLLHITNGFFLASLAFLSVSYWLNLGVAEFILKYVELFLDDISTSGGSTLPPPLQNLSIPSLHRFLKFLNYLHCFSSRMSHRTSRYCLFTLVHLPYPLNSVSLSFLGLGV